MSESNYSWGWSWGLLHEGEVPHRLELLLHRLLGLRHNVFFGAVPKPGDTRQGPPRDQCHDAAAIAHARCGYAHVEGLAAAVCDAEYSWDTDLLAYQVRYFLQPSTPNRPPPMPRPWLQTEREPKAIPQPKP